MTGYLPGRSKDRSRGLDLTRVMSASENCLVAGMANLDLLGGSLKRTDDDDDAMTVWDPILLKYMCTNCYTPFPPSKMLKKHWNSLYLHAKL
jgi:streptomycin 6-kinase